MPKSAVVDASVLVSAFLFPLSRPGAVLALAEDGACTLCLSPILIEETRRSLVNPRLRGRHGRDEGEIGAFCRRLADHAAMVTDLPEIGPVCRDPDDDHVIAAALAAGAGFIVTGDKDLLTLGTHAGIRIVSAADFLDDVMRSS